jgi:hypothetical protein
MRSCLLIAVLLLTACGELKSPTDPLDGGDPVDPSATFTRVQNEVFTPNCTTAGCHEPIGHQAGQVLTAGNAYGNIVGVSSTEMPLLHRIEPGDPANSYLYRKITGAGITGDRMPLGQAPLDEAKIRLVRDWIRRGAPND